MIYPYYEMAGKSFWFYFENYWFSHVYMFHIYIRAVIKFCWATSRGGGGGGVNIFLGGEVERGPSYPDAV